MPEGFDIYIALEDQDLAVGFAGKLAARYVKFGMVFHEGRMEWQFYFTADDYERIGTALNAAIGERYVG